jgi:hypothetical protein
LYAVLLFGCLFAMICFVCVCCGVFSLSVVPYSPRGFSHDP